MPVLPAKWQYGNQDRGPQSDDLFEEPHTLQPEYTDDPFSALRTLFRFDANRADVQDDQF